MLKQAIEKSKTDRPGAIVDYTTIIHTKDAPPGIRASALFNRGLAYSHDQQPDLAAADFKAVLTMPDAPANVVNAAKERVERLRKRADRGQPPPE